MPTTFSSSPLTSITNKLLITNGTILTMKPGDTPFVGYILIDENGKISAVEKGDPPENYQAQTSYDASGKIIMPGFISAHSHLAESPFRGLAADQLVYNYPALDGWVEALYEHEFGATAEDFYWYTLQGALDHLVHGITSVYNFTANKNSKEDFKKRSTYKLKFHCNCCRNVISVDISVFPTVVNPNRTNYPMSIYFTSSARSGTPSDIYLENSVANWKHN